MKREIHRLNDQVFDLLVVGGGIHGACVARDAATRGLRVALIERDDFGSATSHNSLKLLHGGFRYLQHADVMRLRQSVRERRYWLWAAPQLTRPLKCVIPLYGHGTRGPAALAAASLAYGILAPDRNRGLDAESRLPLGGVVSSRACRELIPGISDDGLSGGAYWYDGQMLNADRLLLACVGAAAKAGAAVANYVEATTRLGTPQRVDGVQAVDKLTGTRFDIRARLTVNACGPWVGAFLNSTLGLRCNGMAGLSKGMNLVIRRAPFDHAFGVKSSRQADAVLGRDRRIFFFTPWRDRTVVGTSHLPYTGDPDRCHFTEQDVSEFLDEINEAWPAARLTLDDVDYCYGGLTPADGGSHDRGEFARARQSTVIDHRRAHGVDGLLSVVGVKWTTARLVAQRATDAIVARLGGTAAPCTTDRTKLYGALPDDPQLPLDERCREAVRSGMAVRLSDVVFRRLDDSHRGNLARDAVRCCADVMAAELGWTTERRLAEIDDVAERPWWRPRESSEAQAT